MTDTTEATGGMDEEAVAAAAAEKLAADAEAAKAALEAGDKPADPPVDDKKAEDDKSKNDKLDTEVWGTTNDEVGDSVMLMLQNAGITVDDAQGLLLDAVMAGDVTKVDKDKLTAAVGKAQATLILAGAENYINRNNARKTEVENTLHETVGGKTQWGKITEWAKTALKQEELMDYVGMVDQGGRKAALAAKDLKERYEEANGTMDDKTVVPKNTPQKRDEVEPLSRQQYFAEMEKLTRTGKSTPAAQQELWLRREAGKQKNM